MAYTPRLTQPSASDKHWINTRYGGYNNQIVPADYGSLSAGTGSVLANCTGYVHGRWMEIDGRTSDNFGISNGNAATYYTYGDSYERGQVPKLGAIACYSGGLYGGAGHVAIVERINADGSVLVSQSNYGISIFETVTLPAGTYNPWTSSGLVFQGFIYHPNVNPEPAKPTYTLNVINGTPSSATGHENDNVSIAWNHKEGYNFIRWKLDGKGTISNAQSQNTTFTFGDGNATVTAIQSHKKRVRKAMLYSCPPVYRSRN